MYITHIALAIARCAVFVRFGKDSAEADIITDYLEQDTPDWRGAWRAYRTFAAQRGSKANSD